MSAFVNLVALAVPVFTLQVYDRVIGHAGVSTLFGFIIGMAFIVVFDYILRMARSRIMQTVALRIDVLVGHKLFDKLMNLPLPILESKPASFWQSLFRDVDTVRNTISGGSAILVCDLPFVIMFLTLIFVIAAPIAWVLLIIMPLFMFIAWRSSKAMSEANQDERQSTQTRDGLIAEMINGRTTIKALALDASMRPMWADRHAENIENSVRRGAKSDLFSNAGGSLTMLTTIFMTSVGALAIIEGAITMGALIATNMLTGRLIGPLNQLVGQWRSFNSFTQSVDRLGSVFEMASERMVSEVKLDRPNGNIVVEAVTFAFGEDLAPVLDEVSVTIRAHGVHALVGRNGSGKTTLMKVIQGLYAPTTGRVTLDGADIAQFSRIELASWMGYVPQECVLFAGTVRDNIIHRRPQASDEEIIKAATAAGVHSFIIDLPDGYSTDIGEAGRRLSGGQRQRIAIARALLGDPPVLLLDEPSASLDRQAETALRQTLIEIGVGRTVIIVTHSPILLAACDDLVALDKGKVALAGPAREILPRLFGQQPAGGSAATGPQSPKKPAVAQELPKPVASKPAPPKAATPGGGKPAIKPSSAPPIPKPATRPPVAAELPKPMAAEPSRPVAAMAQKSAAPPPRVAAEKPKSVLPPTLPAKPEKPADSEKHSNGKAAPPRPRDAGADSAGAKPAAGTPAKPAVPKTAAPPRPAPASPPSGSNPLPSGLGGDPYGDLIRASRERDALAEAEQKR